MEKELDPRDRYFHRELTWLAFNERVLEEARDQRNPLIERARFLAIFASNLDEFFMVRVASWKRLADSGYNRRDKFGWLAQEILPETLKKANSLIDLLYKTYESEVKKELRKEKVYIRKFSELKPAQVKFVKKYFDSTLFPIMTPMAVDQGHPFPVLPSRRSSFAVNIEKGGETHLAIMPIPTAVPRLLRLPSDLDEYSFILVEEILGRYLDLFFRGYKIASSTIFRVIRDSELDIEEEYSPQLAQSHRRRDQEETARESRSSRNRESVRRGASQFTVRGHRVLA